ncbi:MAG: AmmeMemoRadiSam system protein B [Anaerolineae bacterium]|nr:AmmeMemoRadiSam system protein B [Anaerolineae bacterium]MDW8101804.1 AmmeMemoRadiSam system protein B [Anaerolineae bacterium]
MSELSRGVAFILLLALLAGACARATPVISEIRKPAVAGQFYPSDPEELSRMVEAMLARAEKVLTSPPQILIVPHAGYIFSGQVAAWAFKQVEGLRYDAVVIIGVNHYVPGFQQVSVYAGDAFETPLGLVPIAGDIAKSLLKHEGIVFDKEPHKREHSIEVEVPFIQKALPDTPIVPIVVGEPVEKNAPLLADALAKVAKGRKLLFVASSDLSHYPSYQDARRVDRATLEAILSMDPQNFLKTTEEWMNKGIPNLGTCACGRGAILTALFLAQKLALNRATVLRYANSGDTPFGDAERVVGYGAVAFWKEEGDKPPPPSDLPAIDSLAPSIEPVALRPEQKERLLKIARETIAYFLDYGFAPLYKVEEELQRPSGVFVTLKKHGELRGCMGEILPQRPLFVATQWAALAAAFNDPRFSPLSREELDEVKLEISLLSIPQVLKDPEKVEVGKHGIIIVKEEKMGLLLPQVPIEEGWSREEFLRGVCRKAGLPEDAWKEKDVKLYVFTADVFGE